MLFAFYPAQVPTPNAAWRKPRDGDFAYFSAFEGGQLNRYDTTVTKPFWNTGVPMKMVYREPGTSGGFTKNTWAHPEEAVLHTYQSAYWGSWVFQVADVVSKNSTITFSKGGFQESRGGTIGGSGQRGEAQDYFVENVFEELDAAREWYYNPRTDELFWMPPDGVDPTNPAHVAGLCAPTVATVVALRGAGVGSSAVRNVVFDGVAFTHTLPTFLSTFEQTSGGDWAIHRTGGITLENAENVSFVVSTNIQFHVV